MSDQEVLRMVRSAISALNDAAREAAKLGYEIELSEVTTVSLETAVRMTLYSPRLTRVLA